MRLHLAVYGWTVACLPVQASGPKTYPADTNLGIALRASTACAYSVM